MPVLPLARFIDALHPETVHNLRDVEIRGLSYDSRSVASGHLFFAIPGDHTDGHRFIDQALGAGAAAIVHSQPLQHYPEQAVFLKVNSSRQALSGAAALYYDYPAQQLVLIGVTGTDGKSTTAYFIYQLLRAQGARVGLLSTVARDTGAGLCKNPLRQSTPESPDIHAALAQMVEAGYRFAVLETTSHGLSRRTARLLGLRFEAAVFTNLSHEHLEFHGSFEQYRDDKLNLFRALSETERSFGVVNADDPNSSWFASATARPVLRYAIDTGPADLRAVLLGSSGEYSDCDFIIAESGSSVAEREDVASDSVRVRVRVPVPARFNIENSLAAVLTVARLLQKPVARVAADVAGLRPVVGRMAPVRGNQPFSVVVDYAHSPGSFEKVFPIFRANTAGRLIAVFGSAGERDVQKRPVQGAIAARYSDILVLADEDPRGEDGYTILLEIAEGARRENPGLTEGDTLHLIPDRSEAIRTAVSIARPGDTVVLLGKGHEASIIYRDGPIDWDERQAAQDALSALGYRMETSAAANVDTANADNRESGKGASC